MISIDFSHTATRALTPSGTTALSAIRDWLQRLAPATRPPVDQVLPLAHEALHWVRQPLGRTVTCEGGKLWLTFDSTPQDIVLEAGESHLCADATALLVYALAPARMRLS